MPGKEPVAMTTAAVTPNQDALVSEIHIAAPPERVFQAIIDEKKVMQWWTGDECRIKSFSLEPRKGGRWTYDSKSSRLKVNGGSQFHCEGEVLEYDPPRVLSYTWIANSMIARHRRQWFAGKSLPARAEHWCVSPTVASPSCRWRARITPEAGPASSQTSKLLWKQQPNNNQEDHTAWPPLPSHRIKTSSKPRSLWLPRASASFRH